MPAIMNGAPTAELLEEVVRRIVAVAHPEKIILFGSATRGTMGTDSDLDILVIKAGVKRRETARLIRRALEGVEPLLPKDVIVATPADVQKYGDVVGYILRPALREGKVLYAA